MQVAQTSWARLYGMALSILTLAVTSRMLGPDGRGVVAAASTWVGTFVAVAYLSLPQVLLHQVAGQPPSSWMPSALGTMLGLLAVITAVVWAVVGALLAWTGGDLFQNLGAGVLAIAFSALPAFLWQESASSLLLANDALPRLNRAQVISATVGAGLLLALVGLFHLGVQGALAASGLGQFTFMVLTIRELLRIAPRPRFDPALARRLLAGGAKLHLNAIGTLLCTQANVLIINHLRDPSETAFYDLSQKLISFLQVIPSAMGMVVYTLAAREGPDRAWETQRKLLVQATALMIAAGLVLAAAAPWLIRLLVGEPFLPTVPLFRMMLLATVGMTFSILMSSQWITRGFFLQVAAMGIVIGGLSVLGSAWLVPRHGMYGAAIAYLFTYAMSVLANGGCALWVERRWRRLRQEGPHGS